MFFRKHRRLLDLLVVIALVLSAVVITILFRPDFLTSTLLFFGVPSLYLLWRKPSNFKKVALSALLLGLIWGFSFDFIAEFNHAWGWSTNTYLALPITFFGVVSLDILIWYFFWVFLTVAFYEYFADHDLTHRVSKRFTTSCGIGIAVAVGIVTLSYNAPWLLVIPYAYFVLGVLALIPFTFIVIRRPSLFPKVMEITPFFIFLYLAFELTALYTDLWSFPGHYIGTVSILNLEFPFEEMLFWIILSSAVTAAYHEFYVGDDK